jgi:hypothetical protein
MRTVNVYKYKANIGCGEKVPDGQALFHQWGVDYEEFEAGAGNFSTAIVERSDGKIETPCADMIEFV